MAPRRPARLLAELQLGRSDVFSGARTSRNGGWLVPMKNWENDRNMWENIGKR